jgi:hypothetical protein
MLTCCSLHSLESGINAGGRLLCFRHNRRPMLIFKGMDVGIWGSDLGNHVGTVMNFLHKG